MDKSEIPAVVERKDIAPMQGGPAKFVREIDEYLAGIFDEITQIDENYGKEGAQNILDNATLIYLKSNSVETATKISDKLRSIFCTKLW